MKRTASWLKYLAFGLAVVLGLAGGGFAAGYALDDPGGWVGAGLVAAWLVPVAVLSAVALRRPDAAERVILVVGILLVGYLLLDIVMPLVPRDVGPVAAVSVLGYAVVLAFLGLTHSLSAGVMMLVITLVQLIHPIINRIAMGEGPWWGSGPTGALFLPLLLISVLFIAAGVLSRRVDRPSTAPVFNRPVMH